MADRYWRGGTAAWDGTAGSKWASTVGGAGGASVPTSADDVFFDAASGAVTVTLSTAAANCQNFNCTGFTGTIAGNVNTNIYGSLTLVPGMTWTSVGQMIFQASSGSFTVTTAGKSLPLINFGFSGTSTATWTLQDSLTSSSSVTITSGTFTTNNYNVTASSLSSSNSNTRAINLGSSTVTLSSSTPISFLTNTNLTFNAGTSTIVLSASNPVLVGGPTSSLGVTFYNVSFTDTTANAHTIQSVNTFFNLTVAGPASAGVRQVTFDSRQTINNTLSITGTAGNRRVWFRGATYGIAQTLTINSAPSLTDADFRDIYVIGTAAPISGTRIGDLRGCSGITFSTPKSVYWVTLAGGNWSGNNWAATSGGGASTDNFPLAQDTAIIENTGLNTSATVTLDSAYVYVGTLDMSSRTNAMTLAGSTTYLIHGDWKFGSGVTRTYSGTLSFGGRNTQTITSAGKAFSNNFVIDSYGGTVQLADDLNIGAGDITVTNGTFDTQSRLVTAGSFSGTGSNVRAINLGASTLSLSSSSPFNSTNVTNLTFSAGTSQINCTTTASVSFAGGGLTFNNVSFASTQGSVNNISGANTFNNLTAASPSSAGLVIYNLLANQTITGTLTIAGATAVRRIFVCSSTLGTVRTLTVNSLSATNCDFRDITLAGAAAGSSPTRAGDCGGNTGITFPAPKTVYWNLAGTQFWSATGWCPSSGGTPDINQFPLAQDTAVFDNAGSVTGLITIETTWNIGTFSSGTRSTAMTLTSSFFSPRVHGNWTFGSGVTSSSASGTYIFSGRGTQTITSNGVAFGCNFNIDSATGTVQLADALVIDVARTLTLTTGTFDAATYNVTTGFVSIDGVIVQTLKMGTGTWTLSGAGTVWNINNTLGLTFLKGTANIVLSDTSTTARTFIGAGLSYNKLTIGGTTGISTTTISGNNQFTELASTKTVAHTIALGTTTPTFGAWTVSGTVGNVVTVSGTATITIAGARVSGVDYLALGTTAINTTSPGEFYAGANSTGTGTGVILTAAPAAVTRYWRGGSGTWDATTQTNWSATFGGVGPASVPTSADAVVFDTMSNATAYTVTCTATQLRCASFTMAGPAMGNVTWAGTAPLDIHGNVSLSASGITRSYTGAITLSGSSTGRTFTTNGVTLASSVTVDGVGCGWTLGSAIDIGASNLNVTNGSFSTGNYNVTSQQLNSNNTNTRSITLGSSTVSIADTLSFTNPTNLTFSSGTSQLNLSGSAATLNSGGQTFYNVSYTNTSANISVILTGAATFNNLTKVGVVAAGIASLEIRANQTITGTLTLSAGTNATMRNFLRSDTIGTTRTLTCAAFSGTDVDFRDITIAGAAAPVSGTRLGDCKGNSGITFGAGVNKYWNLAGSNNWSATGWATGSGGTPAVNNFPLAQDTAIFEATSPATGTTTTINASYNIGTIDMSARTSNTMTLATGSTTPSIYGNWINGTGTILSGSGILTFAGRGSQTITSAGKTFTQPITINTLGGSVTLQDAFVSNIAGSANFDLSSGTFNANNFNVTLSGTNTNFSSTTATTRTLALGSGTWTLAGPVWSTNGGLTGLTITGSPTISMTSASAKTFSGGGSTQYSGVTLNQGGAGALTINQNNTFKDITNTYSATGATTISLGTTTQTVTQFTGTGVSGRVLTIQGTSASSPATLILTGATKPNVDYLAITGVRAYSLTDTWYAGANSTNNGSLGWIFASGAVAITAFITEGVSGLDSASVTLVFSPLISETASGLDDPSFVGNIYNFDVSESASGLDTISVLGTLTVSVLELGSGLDSVFSLGTFSSVVSEAASGLEAVANNHNIQLNIVEAASGLDSLVPKIVLNAIVNEVAAALDAIGNRVTYSISVTEIASGREQLTNTSVFKISVTESANGDAVMTARFTWEPIDSSQNPGWTIVPTV